MGLCWSIEFLSGLVGCQRVLWQFKCSLQVRLELKNHPFIYLFHWQITQLFTLALVNRMVETPQSFTAQLYENIFFNFSLSLQLEEILGSDFLSKLQSLCLHLPSRIMTFSGSSSHDFFLINLALVKSVKPHLYYNEYTQSQKQSTPRLLSDVGRHMKIPHSGGTSQKVLVKHWIKDQISWQISFGFAVTFRQT